MFYQSSIKTMLNTSFKDLHVPSTLPKHIFLEPQLQLLGLWIILLWYSCSMGRSLGKENTIEKLDLQKDGEWDALNQAQRNPDFLLLCWRSPSSLHAGQVWQATISEHGVSTWLLIKGLLSNNPLHISKSCCQEPWTSMGWKTTDKAGAEKSNGACIGQSKSYQWLLENVIFILVLQLLKPGSLEAHRDTAFAQGSSFFFLQSILFRCQGKTMTPW